MEYILIDNFNGTLNIVCKDDDSGEPLVFDKLYKAEEQLEEVCQNGIIVPLADTISVLQQCSSFINGIKLDEGEEIDEYDLELKINSLIE
jgi:hypothetical protein